MNALEKIMNMDLNHVEKVENPLFSTFTLRARHLLEEMQNQGFKLYNDDENGKKTPTELLKMISTKGNQVINAIAGGGKALTNDTLIKTTLGLKQIGYIREGDFVYGEDGKPHKVLGVFPQGMKKVCKITFSDNNVIKCSEDHLWTIQTYAQKKKQAIDGKERYETVSTSDLIRKNQLKTVGGHYNYYLPNVAPLKLDADEKYIENPCKNPYELGYKLGCLNKENQLKDSYETPTMYTIGDVQYRINLLQGIIDATSVYKNSSYTIFSTMRCFTHDIRTLAESLGLVVCVNPDETVLNIYPNEYLRTLHTPHSRFIKNVQENKYVHQRYIKNIEVFEKTEPMTCITIDSPKHLYLTEHSIPTHNTTALVFKILFDIENGEISHYTTTEFELPPMVDRTWVCTFLKSGTDDLERSFKKWQEKLHCTQSENIIFSTMDAEFMRCLNAMGVVTNIADDSTLMSMFKRAVKMTQFHDPMYSQDNINEEIYRQLFTLINMWRNRLDKINLNFDYNTNISYTEMETLTKNFAKVRSDSGLMDFTEIMELLYTYLYVTPNPAVQDFCANRFDNIYIDEFQDTSQLAYAILKVYARNSLMQIRQGNPLYKRAFHVEVPKTNTKLVMIGDISQCIYTFRGSDSKILSTECITDFAPTNTPLSVNWRCPSNILNPIVPSIHKNFDSANQEIHASKEGGEFYACHFTDITKMADYLYENVLKDINDGMSVAVLCRTNYDGALPAFKFESGNKFNYSVSSKAMTLETSIPKKMLHMTSLFTDKATKILQDSLELIIRNIRGYDWNELKMLSAAIESAKKDNEDFIWTSEIADIKEKLPTLYSLVYTLRSKGKSLDTLQWLYGFLVDNFDNTLKNSSTINKYTELYYAYSKLMYDMVTDYIKCVNDRYYIVRDGNTYTLDGKRKKVINKQIKYAIADPNIVCQSGIGEVITKENGECFLKIKGEEDMSRIYDDYGDIYTFISYVNTLESGVSDKIQKKNYNVIVTTVHEFKGKEADSVYIWNDSIGVFPSTKTNTLVGELETLREERRLHYVACTRAKKREHILALKYHESNFTKEMDLTFIEPK